MTEATVTPATRKVAINKCYGGFRLSAEAFVEFMRRKGHTIYAEGAEILGDRYWRTPIEQQPEILRTPWYKVPKDQRDEYEAASEAAGSIYDADYITGETRDDPDLIAVIEEFGDRANTQVSRLAVVEIPADVEWCIEEYDGREWVAEAHRTWS